MVLPVKSYCGIPTASNNAAAVADKQQAQAQADPVDQTAVAPVTDNEKQKINSNVNKTDYKLLNSEKTIREEYNYLLSNIDIPDYSEKNFMKNEKKLNIFDDFSDDISNDISDGDSDIVNIIFQFKNF